MEPTPADWPRISSSVYYEEPKAAIDWLCRAFGFEVRLLIEGEGGTVEHSELTFDDGLIMVGTAQKRPGREFAASPRGLGGKNTQALCVYVDDVDAHCARARAAGARITREPRTDDYGEEYGAHRSYGAIDLEGHHWWFMKRVREPRKP